MAQLQQSPLLVAACSSLQQQVIPNAAAAAAGHQPDAVRPHTPTPSALITPTQQGTVAQL
jgi:hypothetical protein